MLWKNESLTISEKLKEAMTDGRNCKLHQKDQKWKIGSVEISINILDKP